ncbi:MAG: ATP-dependent Clp protease ATP-binding subunit [Bacilli bacterium]|nr:ATP-dependent Clp protease ATP-binding subunit [Bacilli bacterium]
MFGNFTEEARKALVLAKKEMQEMHHQYVGSEHLLLGILSIKNNLTTKLKKYGITYKIVKEELIKTVGISTKDNDFFLYTPLLKNILERVVTDSKELNEDITLTNLFLSIISEGEGVAYRLLVNLNINIDLLYKDLITSKDKNKRKKLLIDEIGVDLNKEAIDNRLDPVIGRNEEINRVIEILERRTKNNPILVGNAGVGKSAIAEELARRIVNMDVPKNLLDKRIVSIDVSSLVSGTKYRGDFEEKVKKIINEVINDPNIILFIDEIHTIVGAGSAEGAIDASNILKPYLARGKIRVIGATTLSEYKKSIEKDKALDRRFQKVLITEPNKKVLKNILMNIKDIYESYHGVLISEKIIDTIINLSDRYIYDRFEPDKSIDILDEVSSKVSLKNIEEEKEINEINKELLKIKKSKEIAIKKDNYKKACDIKDKEIELLDRKNELEMIVMKKKKIKKVTEIDVREVISSKTGIPIIVNDNIFNEINNIKNKLKDSIVGQDKAIDSLIEITKKIKLGIKDKNKSYSLLFSGPTGVGKTFLAKKYGSLLTNNVIKLDMNEYSLKESINKLIGSPAGYIGYGEDKNLLEQIRDYPYSVLILDEIEKAHPSILNFFLNVLDEGYCIDNKGEKIRFDNIIIIMTTNAYLNKKTLGFNSKNISNYTNMFSKEFINRIDEVIEFNNLNDIDINNIIYNEIKKYNKRNKSNIKIELDELELIKEKSNVEVYGARKLYRLVKKELDNRLVKAIFN